MKSLIFDKENLRHTIWINKEAPYFKIDHIDVLKGDISNLNLSSIECRLISKNPNAITNRSFETVKYRNLKSFEIHERDVFDESEIKNIEEIEIYFEEDNINDCQLEVFYTTQNLNVSIKAPFQEFKAHFEESNNAKILFSAPFGQGKTTFLKEFFKNEKRYEVFHLFPVNYAVATNEDIFRLIKTEILVKLLQNDSIVFQKEKFKYLETLPQFALKNAHKILAPFLKAIPVVGESAFGIYEKLEEMTQSYFVEHNKLQIDDHLTAKQYIQKAYEDEGSIFEDNFYSQLIRQLIQARKLF